MRILWDHLKKYLNSCLHRALTCSRPGRPGRGCPTAPSEQRILTPTAEQGPQGRPQPTAPRCHHGLPAFPAWPLSRPRDASVIARSTLLPPFDCKLHQGRGPVCLADHCGSCSGRMPGAPPRHYHSLTHSPPPTQSSTELTEKAPSPAGSFHASKEKLRGQGGGPAKTLQSLWLLTSHTTSRWKRAKTRPLVTDEDMKLHEQSHLACPKQSEADN